MNTLDTNAETLTENALTAEQMDTLIADAPAADPCAFVPSDENGVNWVLGKLADARARAARIRENAELMARAEERKADALEWKYGAALQTYLRAEIAGGKKKSVRLFHGVLGYRQKAAAVQVTDPAAALVWTKQNLPEAVTEAIDKKALVEKLLHTGEAPDFARLLPAEDVFYIK